MFGCGVSSVLGRLWYMVLVYVVCGSGLCWLFEIDMIGELGNVLNMGCSFGRLRWLCSVVMYGVLRCDISGNGR